MTDLWLTPSPTGRLLFDDGGFSVTADPDLTDRLTVLTTVTDGRTRVRLTPALAATLGLEPEQPVEEGEFRDRLESAGLRLHGADHLFYLAEQDREALLAEPDDPSVRPLTAADAQAFERFQAQASEQDLEDSYVELDHWAVYGAFVDGELAGAASAYPWNDAPLADLGVLTLPLHRGRGHARRLVRAMARHALARGHELQYRCQLDNHASIAAAASAGLTRFGTWDVLSAERGTTTN
ncbi:GNAT family N-acetyltransferase [Kitasatospora sp. NPDC101183]|uniref:GNAT family N-acetyltransferase n=1 Tax=Kitasatospora sp. NPDC101183 TaxID=3364100 RepID=UPI003806458A